jgi:hypothetical protein
MYRYLYVKEFTMNKNQRLIRERVMKSDYRKVYSLEEIWKWIEWGLEKGIINRANDEKNIENEINRFCPKRPGFDAL